MHLRGISYAFIASLLFGLGAVLVQLLGKQIDATVVALLNLSIGGLFVSLIVLLTGAPLFKALRSFERRETNQSVQFGTRAAQAPLPISTSVPAPPSNEPGEPV
jgi:hypothetical protein